MKKYRDLTEDILMDIYRKLFSSFGARGWWPAETPFEVVIGAILAQNTSWSNAKSAIEQLKSNNLLSPEALNNINLEDLAEIVKSSGYYNQKAKKIKNFIGFFKNYDFKFEGMSKQSANHLREQLLNINGIGEETVDCILLYALDKPVFVIDTYTKRVFSRLGFADERIKYSELQKIITDNLKKDAVLFNEYHALIDYLAHFICKKKPECERCVLQEDCNYYNH